MRRGVGTAKLTKDYIESKISQELIVSKYLDIPIDVVNDCIKNNHLMYISCIIVKHKICNWLFDKNYMIRKAPVIK